MVRFCCGVSLLIIILITAPAVIYSYGDLEEPQTFKELVEEQEKEQVRNLEKAQDYLARYKQEKFYGRIATVLLIVAWFVLIIIIYNHYNKEFNVQFSQPFYERLPEECPPGELSALLSCTTLYSPELLSTVLDLVRRGILSVDVFPDEDGESHYGLLLDLSAEEEVSDDELYLTNWLFNKIGDGQFVSFKRINQYAASPKTGGEFKQDYQLWVSRVNSQCEEKGYIDKSRNAKIIGSTVGFLYIITSIILMSFCHTSLPILLSILGAFLVYRSFNIIRRSVAGQEQYEKWLAFKRFIKSNDSFGNLAVNKPEIWEKCLVYSVALNAYEEFLNQMGEVMVFFENSDEYKLFNSFDKNNRENLKGLIEEFIELVGCYTSRLPRKIL